MTTCTAHFHVDDTCTLCRGIQHDPRSEYQEKSWATECARHSTPVLALKRHTDSPTAGEWYALFNKARRLFPEYRWERPVATTNHFYLHSVPVSHLGAANEAAPALA